MLKQVGKLIGSRRLIDVNYDWVERWALGMGETYAPSTIKKRVEFLGRAIAWGMRREKVSFMNNPVSLLPKGYATKTSRKSACGLESGIDAWRLHRKGLFARFSPIKMRPCSSIWHLKQPCECVRCSR